MTGVFPRNSWTSAVPRSGKCADLYDDIDYFTPGTVRGIVVHYHGGEYPLLNRDPAAHFESIRAQDVLTKNLSDIKYNLGVAPRVRGVWELRGLKNKGSSTDSPEANGTLVAVYCQLAIGEKPTDILLENLRAAFQLVRAFYPHATEVFSHGKVSQRPTACPGEYLHAVVENKSFWEQETNWEPVGDLFPQNLYPGDTSIYVHQLVSQLSNWGYYKGKNSGVYDENVVQAVRELQVDLKEGGVYSRTVDGQFGPYTRKGWRAMLSRFR